MYFSGLIGHQDVTVGRPVIRIWGRGVKAGTLGQFDCHDYKCDLSADWEHGEEGQIRDAQTKRLAAKGEDTLPLTHSQSTPPLGGVHRQPQRG